MVRHLPCHCLRPLLHFLLPIRSVFDIPPELITDIRETPGELMQQRRLRLGDSVDDYCPRERRVTNHVIVSIVDDEIKQTRCATCDVDHEYKQAKVPSPRRKRSKDSVIANDVGAGQSETHSHAPVADESMDKAILSDSVLKQESPASNNELSMTNAETNADDDVPATSSNESEDEGPVNRPLIRATLSRPEGQTPERKLPDFTVRQPGFRGRSDSGNNKVQRKSRRKNGRGQQSGGNHQHRGQRNNSNRTDGSQRQGASGRGRQRGR